MVSINEKIKLCLNSGYQGTCDNMECKIIDMLWNHALCCDTSSINFKAKH